MFGEDLEPAFLQRLAKAPSNLPEHRNGKLIYEKFVKPAIIDREKLGAHFAVSSLFEEYPEKVRIYSCTFEQQHRQVLTAGKARLILGRSKVTFEITRAWDVLSYVALHLGDHNVNSGVRFFRGDEAFQQLVAEFSEAFNRADFPQVIRLMDKHFGESYYSLKNLFRDEQRKVLGASLWLPPARTLKAITARSPTSTPRWGASSRTSAPRCPWHSKRRSTTC